MLSCDLKQAQPLSEGPHHSVFPGDSRQLLWRAPSTSTARVKEGPGFHCIWSVSGLNFCTARGLSPGGWRDMGTGG